MASGVNLTGLIAAVDTILSAGMAPRLVTGSVPIALSDRPSLGAFGTNVNLPRNMSEYRAYMNGIATGLLQRYGLAVVRSFKWGVFTEYNNQDWLNATADEFLALYDYTACGLQDAIGAENLVIGAHACVQCQGPTDWDPRRLLDHIKSGTPACQGRNASSRPQLNFISNSFYETAPGAPGDLSWLAPQGLVMRAYAEAIGLDVQQLRFGIDEGRLLFGPEQEYWNYALTTRAVGTSYQASFDSLFFDRMVTGGMDYYSRWGLAAGTSGLGPDATGSLANVAGNVALLTSRLAGSTLAAYNLSLPPTGGLPPPANLTILGAVVSVAAAPSPAAWNVVLYHHHPWFNATSVGLPPAAFAVTLCDLCPGAPTPSQTGNLTQVDDAHAQFWPRWMADARAHNLTEADFDEGWSMFSDNVPVASAQARALFAANLPTYRELAQLVSSPVPLGWDDGCITVSPPALPVHSMQLLQVQCSE
jgi:hypothetical protein